MTTRPLPALVAPHRAEVLLGIRHGRLAELVKQGRVRSVPWLGRIRIPREEVERIQREGLTATGRRPRARSARAVPGAFDAEAARRLNLEDL